MTRLCKCGCGTQTTRTNYAMGHSARSALLPRLYSRLTVDPSGCLLWEGPLDRDGYGRLMVGNRQVRVYRVMYELFVGPIPGGLEIDHLCRVPRCAAPAHLEAVTHRENGLRGTSMAALNARKTHCDNGHEFTPENTRISGGIRWCRACSRANSARYQARKKAAS